MEIETISEDYNFIYKDITYEINKINPRIEMYRKIEMLKIIYKFKVILDKYKIIYRNDDVLYNVINRYIFFYFSEVKYSFVDPLFPYVENPDKYDKIMEDNIKYIFKSNIAKKITKELKLDKMFKNAIIHIKNIKNIKSKKSFSIIMKDNTVYFKSKIDDIFSYKIPVDVYNKMDNDYKKYKNYNSHSYDLDELIYCLLIRYDTLFSRGNQWSMPKTVKEKFRKKFNINFEIFASSFNHHYDYYCSIFYDIEKYFMSIGPFQNVRYIKGFYMANPPYEEKLLYQMYSVIENSLDNTNDNLTFIIGTPSWDKYNFELHDIIKKSKYYRSSYKLQDKEVRWYDFIEKNYMRIPSNIRYVIGNNKSQDLDGVSDIIEYWKKF